LFLPDIFLESNLFLVASLLSAAKFMHLVMSSPWSVKHTNKPSPLPHLEPPSKQNRFSITPYFLWEFMRYVIKTEIPWITLQINKNSIYLKCRSSQTPANLGGTPVVIENLKSCMCNLAGPADIFDLGGQDDIWIKNCWSANTNIKWLLFKIPFRVQ